MLPSSPFLLALAALLCRVGALPDPECQVAPGLWGANRSAFVIRLRGWGKGREQQLSSVLWRRCGLNHELRWKDNMSPTGRFQTPIYYGELEVHNVVNLRAALSGAVGAQSWDNVECTIETPGTDGYKLLEDFHNNKFGNVRIAAPEDGHRPPPPNNHRPPGPPPSDHRPPPPGPPPPSGHSTAQDGSFVCQKTVFYDSYGTTRAAFVLFAPGWHDAEFNRLIAQLHDKRGCDPQDLKPFKVTSNNGKQRVPGLLGKMVMDEQLVADCLVGSIAAIARIGIVCTEVSTDPVGPGGLFRHEFSSGHRLLEKYSRGEI